MSWGWFFGAWGSVVLWSIYNRIFKQKEDIAAVIMLSFLFWWFIIPVLICVVTHDLIKGKT